jgi:hypothetical protein
MGASCIFWTGCGLVARGAAGAAGAAGALDRVRLAMGACGFGAAGGAGGATLGVARWGGITLGASCWGEFVTGLAVVSTLGDGVSGCGTGWAVMMSTGARGLVVGTSVGNSDFCGL